MGHPSEPLGMRLFRLLLRCLPADFRVDYAGEMEQTFRAQQRDAQRTGSSFRLWTETIVDVMSTAPREHLGILRQDVQYAFRSLRRAPLFALASIATMAVGIGGVAVVAAAINGFIVRPLPVDRPDELVSVATRDAHAPVPHGLSFLDLQDYRTNTAVVSDMAGYTAQAFTLEADNRSERVTLELVTDTYFHVLAVRPFMGRLIQPGESRGASDPAVIVLAYDTWMTRFAADPHAIGHRVRVNGWPATIVGVTPPAFRGADGLVRPAGWVPASMSRDLFNAAGPSILERRGAHAFATLARLQPGRSAAEAQSAFAATAASLARTYPNTNRGVAIEVVPERRSRPNPGLRAIFGFAATASIALAVLLLLLTTANVANLMLSRATDREREVALRSALGARHGRIVRQLLTESVLLTSASGLVALPVVMLLMHVTEEALVHLTSVATLLPDLSVDWRVVAGAMAVSAIAGISCGLLPALHAVRTDLNTVLKAGGRGTSAQSRRHVAAVLVVVQVAASLSLLVAGGLFQRSLSRARDVRLGFDADGLSLASVSLDMRGYDAARRRAFYEDVQRHAIAAPLVEGAAWTSWPPFAILYDTTTAAPADRAVDDTQPAPVVFRASVSAGYFATARIPVVDGRAFDERDERTGAPVAIVNQALARKIWGTAGAVGRQLRIDAGTVKIVGVVGDGKYLEVWESREGMVFRPFAQDPPVSATLVVRAATASASLAATIAQTIRTVDSDVAPYDMKTMTEHLDSSSAFLPFRIGAMVTGVFGVVGAILAAVGLYGVVAYQRQPADAGDRPQDDTRRTR